MTTTLWTIAFTEPDTDAAEPGVAAVGACDREDAVRRARDVLGEHVTVLWAEPAAPAAVSS